VSIVSATAGLRRSAGSFRAFVDVHMTISAPFQWNPIGIDRGVPSSATKASRVRSRARSSWLSGWLRTSSTALLFMIGLLLGWPVWSAVDIPGTESCAALRHG
jgi:hypothetical protein